MAPLQQLNLKVRPEVVAYWQALAAAEGLSVRDWLLATLAPTAEPPPLPCPPHRPLVGACGSRLTSA